MHDRCSWKRCFLFIPTRVDGRWLWLRHVEKRITWFQVANDKWTRRDYRRLTNRSKNDD